MRRGAHREEMRRRAGVVKAVQAGRVANDACGQKMSETDAKAMQLQRKAASFLRDHAELRRALRGNDFERDLPDAAKMHEAARLFESGGLGVRVHQADALRCHKFAAALGHRESRGVVGEYAETGAAERRRPRRARTLCRAELWTTMSRRLPFGLPPTPPPVERASTMRPARPRRRRDMTPRIAGTGTPRATTTRGRGTTWEECSTTACSGSGRTGGPPASCSRRPRGGGTGAPKCVWVTCTRRPRAT